MSAGIVLLYHGISDNPPPPGSQNRKYWHSSRSFHNHLKRLVSKHRLVTLDEFWTSTAAGDVVLTIDDGYLSDYEKMWPVLLEFGVCGTFFLNTANVGRPGFVSWSQVKEMQRSGMKFGSHSRDHITLTRLSSGELTSQLGESKDRLEERLGCAVNFFSAPFGQLSLEVIAGALRAGYRGICTSHNGQTRPGDILINRVPVYRNTGGHAIEALADASCWYFAARALRSAFVFLPKQMWIRLRQA